MSSRGFTLVELLTVITIIAVLAGIGLVNFQGVQSKGRDSTRKSDLRALSQALEIYYQKNDAYIDGTPAAEGDCASDDTGALYSGIFSYMANQKVPVDPQTFNQYCYVSVNSGQSFRLFAKLENCSDKDIINPAACTPSDWNFSVASADLSLALVPTSGPSPTTAPTSPPSTPTPTSIPSATPIPTPTSIPLAGNGSDGPITAGFLNINTTNHAGRTCSDGGDAVNYTLSTNASAGATSIVINTIPSLGCLTAGDEILIINLQGTAAGQYETKILQSSPASTTLNLTSGLSNSYVATQKIMVQRVPNYTNVTVPSSAYLLASSFNGTKGGVVFFRANGTVSINSGGIINMNWAGLPGGAQVPGGARGEGNTNGSIGINGLAGQTPCCAGGGGGGLQGGAGGPKASWPNGGSGAGGSPGGGGGGSYGSAGTTGNTTSGAGGKGGGNAAGGAAGVGGAGSGGIVYGQPNLLNSLLLGSGGGGGGSGAGGGGGFNKEGGQGGDGGIGGTGGGIIYISASTISNSGFIYADGNAGGGGGNGRSGGDNQGGQGTTSGGGGAGGAGGGGGSGGSIWLQAPTITLGTVSAVGGTGSIGGDGGPGGYCDTNDPSEGLGGGGGGAGKLGGDGGSGGCGLEGPGQAGTSVGAWKGGTGGNGRIKCDNSAGNCTGGNPPAGSSEVLGISTTFSQNTKSQPETSLWLLLNQLLKNLTTSF